MDIRQESLSFRLGGGLNVLWKFIRKEMRQIRKDHKNKEREKKGDKTGPLLIVVRRGDI
jgi:hypothetical protein